MELSKAQKTLSKIIFSVEMQFKKSGTMAKREIIKSQFKTVIESLDMAEQDTTEYKALLKKL